MANPADVQRYLANLFDERNSAYLYGIIADNEKNPKIAELFRRLSATELKHAEKWAAHLRSAGAVVPEFRPAWRTKVFALLVKRLGAGFVIPSLATVETGAADGYARQPEAAGLAPVEKSHARMLNELTRTKPQGMEGVQVARMEGRHKSAGGNALRAAVLGASDGLVSNFNLVMGVAGAAVSKNYILLTGFAGLLAGAISMALGEWISVQSSRELYQKQIRTEKEEIATAPEEEVEELVLIYQARGMDEESARKLASRIMTNPDTALQTLVRDELNIDPEELGGSAWEAAVTSFLLFAAGAILPVIPFFFLSGTPGTVGCAALSTVGLFLIGGATTLFTGRSVLYSGFRQVAFGLISALIVFAIGRLIGVSLGS